MKRVILFILIYLIFLGNNNVLASDNFEEIEKIRSLAPVGYYGSQYSPWVVHQPGWETYLIYYCKNVAINGKWTDRVYRAEGDGKTSWISDRVVIEGTWNEDDALSCSPGMAIDNNNVWHMYYIAANNIESKPGLYIYHATAMAPGLNWVKKGKITVEGTPQPIFGNEFIETPSPRWENGEMIMTFTGNGKLYQIKSQDGHNFSRVETLISPRVGNGRVRKSVRGGYYLVYDFNPISRFEPSDRIAISYSTNGQNFPEGKVVIPAGGEGWDKYYKFTEDLLEENQGIIRIYYAANSEDGRKASDGEVHWWGVNTAIGYRRFRVTIGLPSPTLAPPTLVPTRVPTKIPTAVPTQVPTKAPTLPPVGECGCSRQGRRAGDGNCDGLVDLRDFEVWRSEMFDLGGWQGVSRSDWKGDFNCDNRVDLLDFEIWRRNR